MDVAGFCHGGEEGQPQSLGGTGTWDPIPRSLLPAHGGCWSCSAQDSGNPMVAARSLELEAARLAQTLTCAEGPGCSRGVLSPLNPGAGDQREATSQAGGRRRGPGEAGEQIGRDHPAAGGGREGTSAHRAERGREEPQQEVDLRQAQMIAAPGWPGRDWGAPCSLTPEGHPMPGGPPCSVR